MDSFAQMHIFFLITSCITAVVGVLVVLVLYRVWRILGHIERLSQTISDEGTRIREDIGNLRSKVGNLFTLAFLANIIRDGVKSKTSSKRRSKPPIVNTVAPTEETREDERVM